MNQLLIGGIYTDIDNWIHIIIDQNEKVYFDYIIRTNTQNLKSNSDILNYMNYIFELNKDNEHHFCHCNKTGETVKAYIDGYLGQIPDKVLKKLKDLLVMEDWYPDWK